jgi:hypothetical protein
MRSVVHVEDERRSAPVQPGRDLLVDGQDEAPVVPRAEQARPGVEELDHLGAGLDLGVEVHDGQVRQPAQQGPQHVGLPNHHPLQAREAARTPTLHQVTGQRERSPGEADERNVPALELLAQPAQGLEHVGHRLARVPQLELRNLLRAAQGLPDHGPGLEVDVHARAEQRDEDVREYDHGLGPEQVERLERHLHGGVHVAAQLEKREPLAHASVLGQVAPGLSHQPDRGTVHGRAATRAQQTLAGGQPGRSDIVFRH